MNPAGPIYDNTKPQGKAWWLGPVISVLVIVVTALKVHCALQGNRETAQETFLTLAAVWAVGAPLWFFCEYYFLYRKAPATESWELFKHGQQVSIALWAGVTAILIAVGSSDIAKPKKTEFVCSLELVNSNTGSTPSSTFNIKCPK